MREGLKRKRLKIVDFDWFELSAGPGRVEKVAKYCHRHALKKEEATRRERERIERGKCLAERFVNPSTWKGKPPIAKFSRRGARSQERMCRSLPRALR